MQILGHTQTLYHVIYSGASKHCFNGIIVVGASITPFILSFTMLNAAVIVFYTLVNQSEFITILILQITTAIFQVITTFSDPGRVPRIQQHYNTYLYESISDLEQYLIPYNTKYDDYSIAIAQNRSYEIKFCDSCQIFKPPQTAHCRICDNCVQQFDHHCIWLGTCIGRKNYRSFYAFIWSTFVMLLLISISILNNLSGISTNYIGLQITLLILAISFLLFTAYLVILHTYLVLTNITTYDHLTTNNYVKEYFNSYYNSKVSFGRVIEKFKQNIICRLKVSNTFQRFDQLIYTEMPFQVGQKMVQDRIYYQTKMRSKKPVLDCEKFSFKEDSEIIITQELHKISNNVEEAREMTEHHSKLDDIHIYTISPTMKPKDLKLQISQSQLFGGQNEILIDQSKAYRSSTHKDDNQFIFNDEIHKLKS